MKTQGKAYARARKLLPVIALWAAAPVSAQRSFALQNNNTITGRDKQPVAGYRDYFIPAGIISGAGHITPMAFFASSPVKNNHAAAVMDHSIKPDAGTDVKPGKKISKFISGKISFRPTSFVYPQNPGRDIGIAEYSTGQLLLYALVLKQYAMENGYDTTYAFLSNMGMLCDKKRFFVVNLQTMEAEQSGLVAHGRGSGLSRFDKQYSNIKESKCTSLGRYRILNKYQGEYGDAYRLTGLDSSNANAYSRNIVLHSMGCIPDTEENVPVCISEGCPAVSVNFLSSLCSIIDSRKKPVLLWIYDSNLEEVVVTPTPEEVEAGYHNCSLHSRNNPYAE